MLPAPRYQVYLIDWDDLRKAYKEGREYRRIGGRYFIKDHHTGKKIYPPDLYKVGTNEYWEWLWKRAKLLNEQHNGSNIPRL